MQRSQGGSTRCNARCFFATRSFSVDDEEGVLWKRDISLGCGSVAGSRHVWSDHALAGASRPRPLLQGHGGRLKREGSSGDPGSSLRCGRNDGVQDSSRALFEQDLGHPPPSSRKPRSGYPGSRTFGEPQSLEVPALRFAPADDGWGGRVGGMPGVRRTVGVTGRGGWAASRGHSSVPRIDEEGFPRGMMRFAALSASYGIPQPRHAQGPASAAAPDPGSDCGLKHS